jgi:hypothetical protein
MTLTAFEVSSLADALTKWEYAEYFFASLVTLACLGEFIAEFTNWFTRGVEHRKKRLEKVSTLLLVGALALELVCLVQTNWLSGKLIGSLSEQARAAVEKSKKALDDSSAAITRSGTAEATAGNAVATSDKARGTASTALDLATGARKEADSFERDIVSAKEQAASAESHLAEALQRATEAAAALERIKSPRTLTNVPELISAIEGFKDTEYTFSQMKNPSDC